MRNALSQMAMNLSSARKKRQGWQKIVSVLAAIVVFCTTYALILPAITMEKEAICGFEEHEHSELCFEKQITYSLTCISELSNEIIVHSHNDICYDRDGNLICALTEVVQHSHGESCYDEAGNQTCTMPEISLHSHGEECYESSSVLICTMSEVVTHVHEAGCYEENDNLICSLTETEGHKHTDICYTEESNQICELAEEEHHFHEDTCYTEHDRLICELTEMESHVHGDDCYDADGQLICGLEETEGHLHCDSCYEKEAILHCGLKETEGHEHGEGCYVTEHCLCCELEEMESHTHAEICYEKESTLICSLQEVKEHKHEAKCYDSEGSLICTLPEVIAHTHEDVCYEMQNHLVCNFSEVYEHVHNTECLAEETSESVLVCQTPVHIHGDACFEEPESEENGGFLCASGEHAHSDTCYNAEGVLNCTIPEHVHDVTCIEENVDVNADVETQEQWEQTISQLILTDDWSENLLAVAQTQMGYQESVKNLILENGVLKGYTRFGAWYGIPYGDWDVMFTSFCLHYAGIPESVIPWENNGQRWMENLQNLGLLDTMETHTPKVGDLIFYDRHNGTAIGAGIVTAVQVQTNAETGAEEVVQMEIISGDVEDKVAKKNVLSGSVKAVLDVEKAQQIYDGTYVSETEQNKDSEMEIKTQMAETENYIVTVTYSSDLVLPEGAELKVFEYAKDSEVFKQRCKEAGYELEWLLNIGFFVGDTELDLDGRFDVTITGKQGDEIAGDVTHFADDGMERIGGSTTQENGQPSVMFSSGSFSDFGGGIASLAEATGSQNAEVTLSLTGYNPYNEVSQISFWGGNTRSIPVGSHLTLTISSSYVTNRSIQLNVTGGKLVSTTYTCGTNRCNHRECTNTGVYTVVIEITDPIVEVTGTVRGGWWGNNSVSYEYHPHAVHTGEVNISRLRFYNICENGNNGITALPGCVFEVVGANGYKVTLVSGDEVEVHLPSDIPDGTYTITEVSAPEGHMRDTRYQRTFSVKDGVLVSTNNIGTFVNHHLEQLVSEKTAEVEDYNNRMYQILLQAETSMRMYELGPVDVLFVVDQSNSMLFPAGMNAVSGKKVRLYTNNGSTNLSNIERLGLDKSQMYYVISDPQGTSTAFCLWYDGTTWMYQDASYYAKAKHGNIDGYKDPNETAIFPENRSFNDQKNAEKNTGTKSNGGGLGHSLAGSNLGNYIDTCGGSQEFQIYVATDEYNRLHYLEEALANMIYELADSNQENTVTLVRFTKEVLPENCMGPYRLTPDNADKLVAAVTSINTGGGTRQDIALQYTYNQYLNNPRAGFDPDNLKYTILVTDGAPVRSGSDAPSLGGANDNPTTNGTIYGQIKGYAQLVRNKSTLMTVGLGLESVEAGKSVLQQIATPDESGKNKHYCALDDAADLVQNMQNLLFESFNKREVIDISGDLVDEISDSFYPIAWVDKGRAPSNHMLLDLKQSVTLDTRKDWIVLQVGDWITLDGKYVAPGSSNAVGQLQRKADGTFYIQWNNQVIFHAQTGVDHWDATFYVKAKEDFIGGNAIDTNKKASITVHEATEDFPIPTVNVRLLDMNELHSEVTVYLGDIINEMGNSPLDSLKYFYENTKFTKLISNSGDVLNKVSVNVSDTNGLEDAIFYLRYAMGRDLSQDEWTRLTNDKMIIVDYTYDDASSHGPVGYFVFELEKSGLEGANLTYEKHEATATCQSDGAHASGTCRKVAETYTLHIIYNAHELGIGGRPTTNMNNGAGSPGTEVGKGTTLENGLGVIEKDDIHEVHVISGKIVISKKFDKGIMSEKDHTFTFSLHRVEDGTDFSRDITKTIIIPANETEGLVSITFDNLCRGTYTVVEAADEEYAIKGITVLDGTNCYSTPTIGESAMEVTFVMGNNISNENVIGRISEEDRYTSYTDPVNGVYGEAVFTNGEIVYTGEIPVMKSWEDGSENHKDDTIYLALYKDDIPVVNQDGYARLLKLNAENNWQGSFTVVLANQNDSVTNYNYSIREVSQISEEKIDNWTMAVLENTENAIVYYEKPLRTGELLEINGKYYMVQYEAETDGAWIVENKQAVKLPETGGMGTHYYTFGGVVLIIATLMYGCKCRRSRERGEF